MQQPTIHQQTMADPLSIKLLPSEGSPRSKALSPRSRSSHKANSPRFPRSTGGIFSQHGYIIPFCSFILLLRLLALLESLTVRLHNEPSSPHYMPPPLTRSRDPPLPTATSSVSEWREWASKQPTNYGDFQTYMHRLMEQNCPKTALDEMRTLQNDHSNNTNNKTLVFSTYKKGMCDRTSTAVGLFYLSHFAGRSFKMEWLCQSPGPCSSLFLGYDSPYFDLEWKNPDHPDHPDWVPAAADTHSSYSFHVMNYTSEEDQQRIRNRFRYLKYDEWIPDNATQYRIGQSTGGTVRLLLNNTYYQPWFEYHGFTRETAFACGYNYLFQPTPLAFRGMEPYFNLLQREELFKIGLHIRAYMWDDKAFRDQSPTKHPLSEWMNAFAQCALEIEAAWNVESKPPLWFVISDSIQLKSMFRETFPSRVVLMEDATIQHAELANDQGMLSSIREHWLFGMNDYHIVRESTSFGKSGAVRGFRKNSVYQVELKGNRTKCDRFGFRPYSELEKDWVRF